MKESHMERISALDFPSAAVPATFGEVIAKERRLLGWTQQQLAEKSGLTRETIARLEKGAGKRKPTGDTVFRLESALDLEPGTLVPGWPEWKPIGTMTFGSRSRERRRALNIPITIAAKAAGVSMATLSRFEREFGACPTLSVVEFEEGMPVVIGLRSVQYATALGFASIDEHERYCMGGD
jgi:transcriptional regulator with XRE-family HTH domain